MKWTGAENRCICERNFHISGEAHLKADLQVEVFIVVQEGRSLQVITSVTCLIP